MHHREHPDVIGLENVNDCAGERAPEVPPSVRRAVDAKERGLGLDLRDESRMGGRKSQVVTLNISIITY